MKKPIYYVDMDGVLAVWNESASEEDTHVPGYFKGRERETSAVALVQLLKRAGEDVRILSSVYQDDHSADDKRAWLKESGLGDIKTVFVPYGEDKARYVSSEGGNPVLIDDYSRNLAAWRKSGYTAVKFFNGVNNRPKLEIVGDTVKVKLDGWDGYSIDHRMSPEMMFTIVTAVGNVA